MFDLSNEKVNVTCSCGKTHVATLKQAMNRAVIKCTCGTNIRLNDADGSVKKGVNEINDALKRLSDMFK